MVLSEWNSDTGVYFRHLDLINSPKKSLACLHCHLSLQLYARSTFSDYPHILECNHSWVIGWTINRHSYLGDADLMSSVMELRCAQGFNDYEVIGRSMGTVSISSDVAVLVSTPGVDGSQIRRMKPYFCFSLSIRLCLRFLASSRSRGFAQVPGHHPPVWETVTR